MRLSRALRTAPESCDTDLMVPGAGPSGGQSAHMGGALVQAIGGRRQIAVATARGEAQPSLGSRHRPGRGMRVDEEGNVSSTLSHPPTAG